MSQCLKLNFKAEVLWYHGKSPNSSVGKLHSLGTRLMALSGLSTRTVLTAEKLTLCRLSEYSSILQRRERSTDLWKQTQNILLTVLRADAVKVQKIFRQMLHEQPIMFGSTLTLEVLETCAMREKQFSFQHSPAFEKEVKVGVCVQSTISTPWLCARKHANAHMHACTGLGAATVEQRMWKPWPQASTGAAENQLLTWSVFIQLNVAVFVCLCVCLEQLLSTCSAWSVQIKEFPPHIHSKTVVQVHNTCGSTTARVKLCVCVCVGSCVYIRVCIGMSVEVHMHCVTADVCICCLWFCLSAFVSCCCLCSYFRSGQLFEDSHWPFDLWLRKDYLCFILMLRIKWN